MIQSLAEVEPTGRKTSAKWIVKMWFALSGGSILSYRYMHACVWRLARPPRLVETQPQLSAGRPCKQPRAAKVEGLAVKFTISPGNLDSGINPETIRNHSLSI